MKTNMQREMTENEIREAIDRLEKHCDNGTLTTSMARRLQGLRHDLKEIQRAKFPNALVW